MCWSCFLYGFPKRDKEHVQYAAAYQTRKRHCVFSCRSSRCVCYVLCLFVLWTRKCGSVCIVDAKVWECVYRGRGSVGVWVSWTRKCGSVCIVDVEGEMSSF